MERMKKEKESGTLLGVGTAYLPVKEIKGEFYVKVSDFTKCMDGIRIEQEADRKHIERLEEENKKLKDKIEHLEFDIDAWKGLKAVWEKKEQELQRENDKLKIHIEAKDKAYMGLLTDYNYLKARIKNMEKSYLKFHDDLKKLDDKLDNDIMNR